MFLHIRMVYFCLCVLWYQKSIKWIDRLRLWRKSINLYLCLLAFTDIERPKDQLRSAMVCAFLSALYDYDTDWKPISYPENSVFLQLLRQYVPDCLAREKAEKLFVTDWKKELSSSALERGSGAFRFYCAVINSKWLGRYSSVQLDEYGKMLQEIDDLLDFFHDKKRGEANCFLTEGKPRYVQEVRQFMVSDFFAELVKHSHIYVVVCWYCQHVCYKISDALPPWIKVVAVFRPLTAVYAAGAVLAGFKATAKINSSAVCSAAAFFFVTASIMAFNDFVEHDHDRKKGKYFASVYTWLLLFAIMVCALAVLVCLTILAIINWPVAVFVAFVWIAGLLYSCNIVRRWYIAQTIIVAILSACPLLCGTIFSGQISALTLTVFVLLFVLILIRELAKDVEDAPFDPGFKETFPVRKGVPMTAFVSLILVQVAMLIFCLHPSLRLAAYSLAIIQPAVGLMIFSPSWHRWVKRGVDVALCCILISLLSA